MNPQDHRLAWVQRYADGLASAEEVAQLQAALRADAELRRSFLDYVNLDSALVAAAACCRPAFCAASWPTMRSQAAR